MTGCASAVDRLAAAVADLPSRSAIGLSGYGGAGKTALATALAERLPDVAVVAADGFLVRERCLAVTDDWGGLDRARLGHELLAPFRATGSATWAEYDWATDGYLRRTLPPCRVLLVEGVGVLHPSLRWDLAVWLDVDPDVAVTRAVARDLRQGADVSDWPVWAETDRRFQRRFHPDRVADLVLH